MSSSLAAAAVAGPQLSEANKIGTIDNNPTTGTATTTSISSTSGAALPASDVGKGSASLATPGTMQKSNAINKTLPTTALRRSVTAGAGGPPRPPFLSNPNRQHSQPHSSSNHQQPVSSIKSSSGAISCRNVGVVAGYDGNTMDDAGTAVSTTARSSSSPRRLNAIFSSTSRNTKAQRCSSLPSNSNLATAIRDEAVEATEFGYSSNTSLPPPPPPQPISFGTHPNSKKIIGTKKTKDIQNTEGDVVASATNVLYPGSANHHNVNIEVGTPADIALRANAGVKVTRFDKMSRKLQIPHAIHAMKKTSSSFAHVGLKGKKPPRIPNLDDDNDMVLSVGSDGNVVVVDQDIGMTSPGGIRGAYSADDADDMLMVPRLGDSAAIAERNNDDRPTTTTNDDDPATSIWRCASDPAPSSPLSTSRLGETTTTTPSPTKVRFDTNLPLKNNDGKTTDTTTTLSSVAVLPGDERSTFDEATNSASGTTNQGGSRSYSSTTTTKPALVSRNSSQGSKKNHRRIKTDSSYVSSGSRSETKLKPAGSFRSITLRKKQQTQKVDGADGGQEKRDDHNDEDVGGNGVAAPITTESIVKKPFVYKRSKKRKGDPSMRKSYVKGKVIDGEHELYALSIAVMLGLKTSIGKTNQELKLSQQQRLKARALAKREITKVGFNQDEVFSTTGNSEKNGGTIENNNSNNETTTTAEEIARGTEGRAISRQKKINKFRRRKRQSSTLGGKRSSSTGGVSYSINMSMISAKAWLHKKRVHLPGASTTQPRLQNHDRGSVELTNRITNSSAEERRDRKRDGAVSSSSSAIKERPNNNDVYHGDTTAATTRSNESEEKLKDKMLMKEKEEVQRDPIWLDSDDFMAVEKYVFRPEGGPETPAHKLTHTFKFKDYSPKAFAYIRRLFGINEYEFLSSVCGNASFIEFISNAKSGQFFFYSSDGKYMIKTMTTTESKFLRRILPHYFRHCAQSPDTLITKFFGMYRVKLYHLRRNVKFIIMNSVFDTDKYISSFFDVKGSKLGRDAKPGEMVKKDNDIRKTLPQDGFVMTDDVRNRMRTQIVLDCKFLESMKIMDYSMLIGIHRIPPSKFQQQYDAYSSHQMASGRSRSIHTNRSMTSTTNNRSIIQSASGEEGSYHSSVNYKTGEQRTNGIMESDPCSTKFNTWNNNNNASSTGALSIDQVVTNVNTKDEAHETPCDASVLTEDDSRIIGEDESVTTTTTITNILNDTTTSGVLYDSESVVPVVRRPSDREGTNNETTLALSNMISKSNNKAALKRSYSDSSNRVQPSGGSAHQQSSFRGIVSDDVCYELDEDESSYLEGSSSQMERVSGRFFGGSSNFNSDVSSTSLRDNMNISRNNTTTTSGGPLLLSPDPSIRKINLDGAFPSYSSASMMDEGGTTNYMNHNNNIGNDVSSFTNRTNSNNIQNLDPVEIRKELATEQMYWPFHRFYNIQGWRRMEPILQGEGSIRTTATGAISDQKTFSRVIANNNTGAAVDDFERGAGNLPIFAKPISDRKDKGLIMNVNRLKIILEANNTSQQQKASTVVEPKIFYMGIIDVLQQFNLRKRAEAKLRRMQGGGWADASCVHPDVYARRFVEFFDEYTLAKYGSNGHARIDEHEDEHEGSNASTDNPQQNEVPYEQIVFFKDDNNDDIGGNNTNKDSLVEDTKTQAIASPSLKSKKSSGTNKSKLLTSTKNSEQEENNKTKKSSKKIPKIDHIAIENSTSIEVTLPPATPSGSS